MAQASSRASVIAGCVLALLASASQASKVIDVAAGGDEGFTGFSLLLRDDGTVWAWGDNQYGELGDGTTAGTSTPTRVPNLPRMVAISAGLDFAVAVDADGGVWAWGKNGGRYGGTTNVLGTGSPDALVLVPARVVGVDNVVEVSAGDDFSLARRRDGTVWAWGMNGTGQLGDGGAVGQRSSPAPVPGVNGAVAISAGNGFAGAITAAGNVLMWGRYTYESGPLPKPGVVAGISSVRAISLGDNTMALKHDGTVYIWGNSSGFCPPATAPTPIPGLVNIASVSTRRHNGTYSLAVGNDGSLKTLDYCGGPLAVPIASPSSSVVKASVSSTHGLAVDVLGRVYARGGNLSGALGLSDINDSPVPVAIPGLDSVVSVASSGAAAALKRDGSVWFWPYQDEYRFYNTRPPSRVSGFTAPVSKIIGAGRLMAVQADGSLWQIGSTATKIAGFADVVDAKDTGFGFFTLTRDGQARIQCAFPGEPYCVASDFGFSDVDAIAAGFIHYLALRRDGTVWGLGRNTGGQLGDGTGRDSFLVPVKVAGLTNVQAVYAARDYSVAIKRDGSAFVWGVPPSGTTPFLAPQLVEELRGAHVVSAANNLIAITSSGDGVVWGTGASIGVRDRLIPSRAPWLDGMTSVTVSDLFIGAAALGATVDGKVYGWGSNYAFLFATGGIPTSDTWVTVKDPLAQVYTANAVPVVEFFNPSIGLGHYFITAYEDEALALDFGANVKGWQRTGRSWRAWPSQASAPSTAKPVYRFFSGHANTHFYTVDEDEKNKLVEGNPGQDPALGWKLESVAFYAAPGGTACPSLTVSPASPYLCPNNQQPAIADCPAGYYPVYRAYDIGPKSKRVDENHRFTSNWIDIYRNVRFFEYYYEGVAFCSPASTQEGGDVQAFNTFPADTVNAGDPIASEYWFGNAGPGSANGATIVAAMPMTVNWLVQCRAYNRAQCPADLTPHSLRTGVAVPVFPAGGVLQLTVNGSAPAQPQSVYFASAIGSPSGAPDPYKPDNAGTVSRAVVKSSARCTIALTPASLTAVASGSSSVVSVSTSGGCAFDAKSDQSWTSVTSTSGTLKIASDANTSNAERVATVTVNTSDETIVITVRQAGVPPPTACATARLSRSGDQIGGNEVTNFVAVSVPTPECSWDAVADTDWIALTAATRTGGGQVEYVVKANDTATARGGTISIVAGGKTLQTFTVFQISASPGPQQDNGGAGDGGGDGGGSGGSGGG